jgi:hypothetical protein
MACRGTDKRISVIGHRTSLISNKDFDWTFEMARHENKRQNEEGTTQVG